MAVLILGSTVLPVHSQQVIEFKNDRVETTFMEDIRFTVDLCGLPPKATANLHLRFSHDNWEILPAFIDETASDACAGGRYVYEMDGYPPFLPMEYYWQVYIPGAGFLDGPHQSGLYEDNRFQWEKLEADNITVFWHDRPQGLGEKILQIAKKADQAQREFYGLELNYPYRIVIFNTAQEFLDWNVDVDQYVAGEAFPFYDLTVQIVEDDSPDWLDEVIPHEISHLYFTQATYRSMPDFYPPRWLDEGVAVYNEFSDHSFENVLLQQAVLADQILPLNQLTESFGDDENAVDLAYAEGYSAVSYIMEVYGRDTLKELMNSYRRGKSTDEAFLFAIDRTFAEFEADWMDWLKEKYTWGDLSKILPFPTDDDSSQVGEIFALALCGLGTAPIFCLLILAGGAGFFILIRRPPER
jgi:hypothetical protein